MKSLLWGMVLCAAGSGAVAQPAAAQAYPEKAIRFIVPWPTGGSADAIGRLIAHSLQTELGKPVFVDNVAGASGNIGTQRISFQWSRSPWPRVF